ncbi:MAG: tetratricopeptide repeat protein, partial [Pseudomonadota bacterium]
NHATAVEWYTKSAAQGYTIAQHNLGIHYENGWGVKQDYQQAAQWYGKAAEQGFGYAYYNLGLLYLNGKGKKKDKKVATTLLKEAYSRNVKQAGAMLESLGVKLPKKPSAHASPDTKATTNTSAGQDAAGHPTAK